MAKIAKDGIYKDDANPPNYFQYRQGYEVGDAKLTYSEAWPESPSDAADAKADVAAENKAAAKPENKSA